MDCCGAFGKSLDEPTGENFARMMALEKEMDAIKAGQLRGTTKRKPRRKDSDGQSRPENKEPEDGELDRIILEAYAKKLRKDFGRAMGW